ncbi:hypothetical protein DFH09DRAFT_1363492, partial [Mycena vulgaris]
SHGRVDLLGLEATHHTRRTPAGNSILSSRPILICLADGAHARLLLRRAQFYCRGARQDARRLEPRHLRHQHRVRRALAVPRRPGHRRRPIPQYLCNAGRRRAYTADAGRSAHRISWILAAERYSSWETVPAPRSCAPCSP